MPGSGAHTGLRVAATAAALAAAACARPQGAWRDQYAFVGDDGTVMVLGLQRQSAGVAEVKGWFGANGRWQANAYHRFDIARGDAPDRGAVLTTWADVPGAPARAAIGGDGGRVDIDLRLPSRQVQLRSRPLVELGRATDPEGTSIYRAGRAQLSDGDRAWHGWLVVEQTPRGAPRKPFVDYGEFAFAVLATADAPPIVLKYSRAIHAYDHAFRASNPPAHTTDVTATVDDAGGALVVRIPDWKLDARVAILDRDRARGTAPDGSPVGYDTLLLGGDYAGIAFVVRPERRLP